MSNFKIWLENKESIVDIPLSNIWIMHWSNNPTNPKYYKWIYDNYEQSFSKNLPIGRIGQESEERFQGYIRLFDEEEYDPYSNDYKVVHSNIPVDNNYPKVFLDDGTHRAKVAFARREKTLKVKLIG